MVWKCLQVEVRAWRVLIVGADWKMWSRISLARSEMCMVAELVEEGTIGSYDGYAVFLFFWCI